MGDEANEVSHAGTRSLRNKMTRSSTGYSMMFSPGPFQTGPRGWGGLTSSWDGGVNSKKVTARA